MKTSKQIKIFILTLEKAQSRRLPLEAQLQKLGLEYELFVGVDGTDGLPDQYEHLIDRTARAGKRRNPMTDGEYACTLSHLFIHGQIIERGLPEAIILEDDASVSQSFADLANHRLVVSGDLVMLDFMDGFFHRCGSQSVDETFTAYSIAVAPVLATGYLMRQPAARYFKEKSLPVRGQADWPCDIRQLKSYALHPRVVGHPVAAEDMSHLDKQRRILRAEHRASEPKGFKRVFTSYYWFRRRREWHRLRYRQL